MMLYSCYIYIYLFYYSTTIQSLSRRRHDDDDDDDDGVSVVGTTLVVEVIVIILVVVVVQAPTLAAKPGSFFNKIKISRIRCVLSSALSCVSSTVLVTRCQELSFSKSASMLSSLACSSSRFKAIFESRFA